MAALPPGARPGSLRCAPAADFKDDTGRPVVARKEARLLRLPRILVLHLARFDYGLRGTYKLNPFVRFEEELR